ncbi:MAG: efflux RND transporter permease subunit [Pseudomonadota bacterium]
MTESAKDRFNLSRIAIENPAITVYLLAALLLAGIVAYFQLGQDEDPPFTIRVMLIQAFWPGATAMQMSEQVTDKLERTLQEAPHVEEIRSYSKPGETTIFFKLRDSGPPDDIPKLWYTVRKKIGDMKAELPPGVRGPFFNDEFGDVYGVVYALSSDGYSRAELKHYADAVRQELLRVPNVAKVELVGVQDEKIYVEISQKKLARMGMDIFQVIDAINTQNGVAYAGILHAPDDDIQVRISGQMDAIEDLKALPLRFAGRNFRLGDIAKIERGYADPPSPKVRYNGKEVIALGISMAKGGDIIALGKALRGTATRLRASLPVGIEMEQVQDQPAAVSLSVREFLRTLAEALVIVLLVSFLALGMHRDDSRRFGWRMDTRPGLVVALSIPTVLAVTFLVMERWGIGLNKVSLGSLIIALGLLIDDAIIIVEMTVRKLEEGYDRLRASTYAYTATAMPMLTGTLITATGFLPIGLADSSVGEYTFPIFAVTMSALLISWVVSVYFVPYLGNRLLHEHLQADDGGQGAVLRKVYDSPFYTRVRTSVDWCVEHRWQTIGATIFALVLGVVGLQVVDKQFFGDSSRPEIMVELWLPEGSSITNTEDVARRFEARMLKEAGVESVTTFIGNGAIHFYLPMDQILPQNNVAQVIVLPTSMESREHVRLALPRLLEQEFPEARTRVVLLPNGPPVPYPVMFRVMGPDPQVVRMLADQVKAKFNADPDMVGVNDNWNEQVKTLRLDVDQSRARALGVTTQSLATASAMFLSGQAIDQYREGDKLIDIVLRQPANERDNMAALTGAYLPTASGVSIPVTQVARMQFGWEPGVLWRHNRNFAITVQGDVAEGAQGATVAARLQKQLNALQATLEPGYRIEISGALAESQKGTASIVAKVPLMLFIIFTLLMLQLRSFSRAVLVFLTGPLGIIGAVMTLLVLDKPMGFVATLGIVALNGMIIRNSVILIDQIEQDIANGVDVWTAIVEAAVRRFRPIMLTAAAAVLAMIPLMHSTFWGPMAVAIMGGLIVATLLTLLSLPAMYAAWFRVTRPAAQATQS